MTKIEAVDFLRSKAWSMWKPGESFTDDKGWHRKDIFAGVQVICTHDEWTEIMEALVKGVAVKEIREDKLNPKLIKKFGKCKSCNGRGYLGTFESGKNCHACKGIGANMRKVPTWRKGKK